MDIAELNRTDHSIYVDSLIRNYDNTKFYYGEIDIEKLSDIILDAKLEKTLKVYQYSFLLFRIVNLIIYNNMDTLVLKDGSIQVWINHNQFIKNTKHIKMSNRTLSVDISNMKNQLGLITSTKTMNNNYNKTYYGLTTKGLSLISKRLLMCYKTEVLKKAKR